MLEFNTTELPVFFSLIPFYKFELIYFFGLPFNLLNSFSFFFLIAAFGKSAQIGLHL